MLTAKRMLWGSLGLLLIIGLSIQLLFTASRKDLLLKTPFIPQSPPSNREKQTNTHHESSANDEEHGPHPSSWTYIPSRDADNPALNSQQCTLAFPNLYTEIDRSVAVWRDHRKHTITAADTSISWRDNGALRLLIHKNQLRILQTKHTAEFYLGRTRAVLLQINRALEGATAVGWTLPTIEFSIVVDDLSLIPGPNHENPHITTMTFTRRADADWYGDRQWLIPDFNFWHTPASGEWRDARAKAAKHDAYFVDKLPRVVWRGAVWTLPEVREALIAATRNKSWADVEEVDWKAGTNVMRTEDFCRYAFVVHTEGRSWSGRLKYLLNCDSLPVVHDLQWLAHYYHELVAEGEGQNFVRVRRDWADLEEKVGWFLERPEEAQRVMENAKRDFRERATSVAGEACYWRKLFEGWSQVAWVPEAMETVRVNVTGLEGGEVEEERLRGMPFGEFVLSDENYP